MRKKYHIGKALASCGWALNVENGCLKKDNDLHFLVNHLYKNVIMQRGRKLFSVNVRDFQFK